MADNNWSPEENKLIVRAYFDIVDHEISEAPITKIGIYRRISEHIGRTAKAVEYKMLNVSGALETLGLGYATGLKPKANYQQELLEILQENLAEEPGIMDYLRRKSAGPDEYKEGGEAGMSDNAPRSDSSSMQVDDLWPLAMGGSEVAVAPGKERIAPTGPRPAGVEEASTWMAEALSPSYEGRNRFLFLVGGPGGGKSDVASRLTLGLRKRDAYDDGLAHRTYRYLTGTREVLLVNDATIPAEDSGVPQTLAEDLDMAIRGHVIACVNRGVLVDEEPREPSESLGAMCAEWLRGGAPHPSADWHLEELAAGNLEYLKQARLNGPDGTVVEALAIFVDVCSLLERRPAVHSSTDLFHGEPYQVAEFEPDHDRTATPAGVLLERVSQVLEWAPRGEWDPIAANLLTLSRTTARRGVLSILRAAELATSQRFAYRQVWGIIARLVAGALPEQISQDALRQHLDELSPQGGDGSQQVFERYRHLASIRLHEALFNGEWDPASRHPILSATSLSDPSRDLKPGHPLEPGDGWATPISEAFAAAQLGASPLQGMLVATHSDILDDYVTSFDGRLDEAFVDATRTSQDSSWVGEATAWYGRYLSRMMGVAHGYPAYAHQLQHWTRAWIAGAVEDELGRGLDSLIRPPRNPHSDDGLSQVPLFASRAEAVLGTPERPLLVSSIGRLTFTTTNRGDELLLHIRHDHQQIGDIQLDLDLVREALVSSEGWLGLTDATESVVPRLERFRSINLTARNRDATSISVIGPYGDHRVTIQPTTQGR